MGQALFYVAEVRAEHGSFDGYGRHGWKFSRRYQMLSPAELTAVDAVEI